MVMRTYFEKPRTTVGWKGLINDPGLDGSFRVNDGLFTARSFLLDVIALGIPVGCEFLDPITPQYLADTVSWGAIGARTSQSQIHRQLASGLSMPIGFKNSTEGDIQVAVDAIAAAAGAQVFPGIDGAGRAAIIETRGNQRRASHPSRRLEPGRTTTSRASPSALERLEPVGTGSPGHRRRQPREQREGPSQAARRGRRALEAARPRRAGRRRPDAGELPRLRAARTSRSPPLVFGQSITDSCIGWDDTVAVLDRLAGAMARRRQATHALVTG